ncbi:IS607 family transposase [Levilactobacillus brevis]|uniref:IS607 family transposase n=1 Tax=Levilactobacillus brevis TaxID=1580 RepID=UPI000D72DB4A|nr:IS607 family transposase [Levilactobacillus brevis]MCM6799425.1 IS607 family transposase [Levilactobacillus brevis]MCM6801876.1 IS607 family transposase [Levilactobacillus brevis]MCM6806570.1 IS607 family transposase [Levilactobacillus brevis]MCM6807467.1 IS607 family transposase [Levilactobacillus brevis]MCM6813351.1 IS607 family transposase [Levilactobacillus brevis]
MIIMKPGEMAKRLGITTTTLRNWDRSGKLPAKRTVSNQRYYTEEDYLKAINARSQDERINVIYARVSTRNQKDDLDDQVQFLQEYVNAKGVIVSEVVTDIGSGLNYKRKKWNALLDEVMNHKVKTIYIAYPDRFIRFGFDWFKSLCEKFGTEIVVVNNEKLSPEAEVVQDLISIIHVFSCRVYGLRKYKKKVGEDKDVNHIQS